MSLPRGLKRAAVAAAVLAVAAIAAAAVPVRTGEAVVVTRLGAPVRVVLEPGLAWILPAPLERAQRVDRRVRTSASGSHGVLTRDGLSLVIQAYAAWKVGGDGPTVLRYVRATGGDAGAAADQLRTLLNSALETVTSRYAMGDLLNSDAHALRLADYEAALRERVASAGGLTLGIEVVQVGIERLLLPELTLQATIGRMSEERRVAAEERQAAGRRAASQITADADKEARIVKSSAEQEAATLDAAAKAEAAKIYGDAYAADPALYVWLRSLDTLTATLAGNARLVLTTDSAPFQTLFPGTAQPARPAARAPARPGGGGP